MAGDQRCRDRPGGARIAERGGAKPDHQPFAGRQGAIGGRRLDRRQDSVAEACQTGQREHLSLARLGGIPVDGSQEVLERVPVDTVGGDERHEHRKLQVAARVGQKREAAVRSLVASRVERAAIQYRGA